MYIFSPILKAIDLVKINFYNVMKKLIKLKRIDRQNLPLRFDLRNVEANKIYDTILL